MLIELACIGILYKCSKKLIKVNSIHTLPKKSVAPKKINREEQWDNIISKIRENRKETTDYKNIKENQNKGFITYEEKQKAYLKKSIKKEKWKEMGLEN